METKNETFEAKNCIELADRYYKIEVVFTDLREKGIKHSIICHDFKDGSFKVKCTTELRKIFKKNYRVTQLFHQILTGELTVISSIRKYKYANRILFSDVDPYEVVKYISENKAVIRGMEATEKKEAKKERMDSFVPGGFIGHYENDLQEWDIISDETRPEMTVRKHKDGYWYTSGGTRFLFADEPRKHYDFNF